MVLGDVSIALLASRLRGAPLLTPGKRFQKGIKFVKGILREVPPSETNTKIGVEELVEEPHKDT